MKNIFKILMVFILPLLLINACRDDADKNWTSPEATIHLYSTTLSSNTLYPSMANNSFRLAWDAPSGAAGNYTVQISTTPDFKTPLALGTATVNSYTTTIATLNTALLQAGYSPYTQTMLYIRVISGTNVSNVISLGVTPYPVAKPVITSPAAGTSFILNKQTPDATVATVTWSDYATYGVPVKYLVEVAKKGQTSYEAAGTVTDSKSLVWTHKMLNDAVTKLGLPANVVGEVNVRVTATTVSVGGTINTVSDVVTIKVTPYVSFINLFMVGDATEAGWDNNNNNQPLFRDPVDTNKFHFSGYFKAGAFKLVEVKGQWQPQWGQNGGVVAVNDGSSSDPDVFSVSTAGYYTFTIDTVAKTYSLLPYTPNSAVYTVMGIVGSATPNGWNAPDSKMTRSALDPHLWSVKGLSLTVGEIKFRVNDDWGINWGSNTPISGTGTNGGANIPVEEAGTYDVYFNDSDGSYLLIKQ